MENPMNKAGGACTNRELLEYKEFLRANPVSHETVAEQAVASPEIAAVPGPRKWVFWAAGCLLLLVLGVGLYFSARGAVVQAARVHKVATTEAIGAVRVGRPDQVVVEERYLAGIKAGDRVRLTFISWSNYSTVEVDAAVKSIEVLQPVGDNVPTQARITMGKSLEAARFLHLSKIELR